MVEVHDGATVDSLERPRRELRLEILKGVVGENRPIGRVYRDERAVERRVGHIAWIHERCAVVGGNRELAGLRRGKACRPLLPRCSPPPDRPRAPGRATAGRG